MKIHGKTVFYYMQRQILTLITVRDERLWDLIFVDLDSFKSGYSFQFTNTSTYFQCCYWLRNFKCRDYYRFLIKCKYEKPKKWAKLRQEFDLEDQHIAEAVLLPIRISSKPYLGTFQYIK